MFIEGIDRKLDAEELMALCKKHKSDLVMPEGIELDILLVAIAMVESSLTLNNIPRYEKSYGPGGYYYKRSRTVRDYHRIWGGWAPCSYSSWQILYNTAVELGFRGSPHLLWNDKIAIKYVIKYLDHRVMRRGASNLTQIADAYNSGNFWDKIVPNRYIRKLREAYKRAKNLMRGEETMAAKLHKEEAVVPASKDKKKSINNYAEWSKKYRREKSGWMLYNDKGNNYVEARECDVGEKIGSTIAQQGDMAVRNGDTGDIIHYRKSEFDNIYS